MCDSTSQRLSTWESSERLFAGLPFNSHLHRNDTLHSSYRHQQYANVMPQMETASSLKGPPVISRKGRQQTQRLTGALEGRPRGGGAKRTISDVLGASEKGATKRQPTRCGICHEFGHYYSSICPTLQN